MTVNIIQSTGKERLEVKRGPWKYIPHAMLERVSFIQWCDEIHTWA